LERKLYYIVAIFLTIAITVGSLISVKNVIELPAIQFFDKFLHFFAYFLLTLSWLITFINKLNQQRKVVIIVVTVFAYGIIIEALQGALTTYRQAELLDLFANFIGIGAAWVFFTVLFLKKYRMK
tara:strand:+ start:12855 stop:13229 length:375 start_codon:yes stop_codon:yes gene_type:complete